MLTGEWLLGGAVALVVANLAAVFLAQRYLANRNRSRGESGNRHAESERDGGVVCESCGTANDPDYRYCRACTDELPGAGAMQRRGGPAGRFAR
jgi:hypothetical protein